MSAIESIMPFNLQLTTQARASRMHKECAVLVSRRDGAWVTELRNISATGVLIRRPRDFDGRMDEVFVLDMVFSDDVLINVEACVRRVGEHEIGLAFTRIPANKEVLLWGMLGAYADAFEL